MNLTGKILILEDDYGIATLESRKVKNLGYLPSIAKDTKTALDLLQNESFEALILDYNLGESITGVEFYNVIKERGIYLPAVLVAGLEDPQILIKAIRAGIRDFVPKLENFLDDLGPALERVMKQSKAEKDAAISQLLRGKNELLETVISAAEMCSVRTNKDSENLENWHGDVEKVFGNKSMESVSSRTELLNLVLPEDLAELKKSLEDSEKECHSFTCHLRFILDPNRWIFAQGRCFKDDFSKNQQTLVMVFFDVTPRKNIENNLIQSNLRMTAINKRLQVGMSEAHHRIKNSLQNISSLLNLNVRKSGNLSVEEAQKLSTHIQGLAKMHELLLDQSNDYQEGTSISITPILLEIINTIQSSIPSRKIDHSLDDVILPSRMACTISVIVNELLSNSIKHGKGNISVGLKISANDVTLSVRNEGSQYPDDLKGRASGRNGLSIIDSLSKGDLGSIPTYRNLNPNLAEAKIEFTISE